MSATGIENPPQQCSMPKGNEAITTKFCQEEM